MPDEDDDSLIARMAREERKFAINKRKKQLILTETGKHALIGFTPLYAEAEKANWDNFAHNSTVQMDTTFGIAKYGWVGGVFEVC